MIVIMRFLKRQGAFCRSCGLAVFREMQANTLVQGWWGPLSVLVTIFTLLVNLDARSTLLRLPEPTGGWRPPLDPGKPVTKRPAGMIALAPLALLAAAVMSIPVFLIIGWMAGDSSPKPLTVNSCARNDGSWSDQDLKTVPCGSADAQFQVTDPGTGECEEGDYVADLKYSKDGETSLCLHPLDR
ncbi:Toxin-antitoxin system, toxin component OS=Streptomyces aurantiogriseus OX=66870 GN=GCM10010251_17190 PE=4 SV=1 [Streptomyces aurantiogriseus]